MDLSSNTWRQRAGQRQEPTVSTHRAWRTAERATTAITGRGDLVLQCSDPNTGSADCHGSPVACESWGKSSRTQLWNCAGSPATPGYIGEVRLHYVCATARVFVENANCGLAHGERGHYHRSHRGQQQVEQGPELSEVVLERRARQQQPSRRDEPVQILCPQTTWLGSPNTFNSRLRMNQDEHNSAQNMNKEGRDTAALWLFCCVP